MPTPTIEPLTPAPEVDFNCPHCDVILDATDWYVPGMRVLAELKCPSCGREYYGDVQTGDAWNDPVLLETSTGETVSTHTSYFSSWLRESYASRRRTRLDVDFDPIDGLERPALVNCLDRLYGHTLLKLLNVQYVLDETDADPVVLVPSNFEWLVPDDVPAVWTVDIPLSRGTEWNDWLAARIDQAVDPIDSFEICRLPPHPSSEYFDINRFTGIDPFDLDAWTDDPDAPNVTFVWRDDRHWSPVPNTTVTLDWLGSNTRRWLVQNALAERAGNVLDVAGRTLQRRRVISFAKRLRERFPDVSVTVAGIGDHPSFPDWINVDVVTRPDSADERRLCRIYADSHVVVGVHGSNMLLPSGHAAAVVDLHADRRWGNLIQDLLLRDVDLPQALFHYHLLPLDTDPETVTEVVSAAITMRDAYD